MAITKKSITIDVLRLNHWLNARKITNQFLSLKHKTLAKKLKRKKNFVISKPELKFLNLDLSIPTEKIVVQDKVPDYIYWTKNKIEKTN